MLFLVHASSRLLNKSICNIIFERTVVINKTWEGGERRGEGLPDPW